MLNSCAKTKIDCEAYMKFAVMGGVHTFGGQLSKRGFYLRFGIFASLLTVTHMLIKSILSSMQILQIATKKVYFIIAICINR